MFLVHTDNSAIPAKMGFKRDKSLSKNKRLNIFPYVYQVPDKGDALGLVDLIRENSGRATVTQNLGEFVKRGG